MGWQGRNNCSEKLVDRLRHTFRPSPNLSTWRKSGSIENLLLTRVICISWFSFLPLWVTITDDDTLMSRQEHIFFVAFTMVIRDHRWLWPHSSCRVLPRSFCELGSTTCNLSAISCIPYHYKPVTAVPTKIIKRQSFEHTYNTCKRVYGNCCHKSSRQCIT